MSFDPNAPLVIRVKTFGETFDVSLPVYLSDWVQDEEIGLRLAKEVLERDLDPRRDFIVYNEGDFFDDPNYVQLHSCLDPAALRSEIERMENEEIE